MASIILLVKTGRLNVGIKYLRMMKADDSDALPLVKARTRDCLAVRVGIEGQVNPGDVFDVLVDEEGKFIKLEQGLSLTIPPKTNIPKHLFKPAKQLNCFTVCSMSLVQNEHLMFIEDSETHAMIVPKYDMHISEYEKHLEDTRPLWGVLDDEKE